MLRFIIIVIFIISTSGLFGSNNITSLEDIKIESNYLEHLSHSMALTGSGTIGGCITTHFGDPVKNVKVKLKSNQPDFPMTKRTNRHGKYKFEHLDNGFNYKICPSKKSDELNGVNFLDVFILYKYLRYNSNLNSPYLLIAADVNNDQTINANDLASLLSVIFRKKRMFPNNNSWRFIDADYEFIDEANPWPFTDDIHVPQLTGDSCENNFVAIKIGDLSGDAHTLYFDTAENRSNSGSVLKTDDLFVQKNKAYTIQLQLNSTLSVQGMQLFLDQTDLEILDIETVLFNEDASYIHTTPSTYKRMWYERNSSISQAKSSYLNIEIRPKKSGMLSTLLKLDKSEHTSEVYSVEEELTAEQIDLEFGQSLLANSNLTVLQNYPNPFTNKTFIEFNLINSAKLNFKVMDTKGAIVYQSIINGSQGKNVIDVSSDEIGSSGIFHYQLSIDNQVITKTMIITK